EVLDDDQVRVDMGVPQFEANTIPPRDDVNRESHEITFTGSTITFNAVSMGNPHAVIEVDDVDAAEVSVIGPALENSPLFPERCNVGFVQVLARDHVRLRVWERGVGETRACGTGACAAIACLRRRGRVEARVAVDLPGGRLLIDWEGTERSLSMTGPATFAFEGEWRVA
ncbi:MAG: diaminopimelate epimerase, partial [Dokdonella sp.]